MTFLAESTYGGVVIWMGPVRSAHGNDKLDPGTRDMQRRGGCPQLDVKICWWVRTSGEHCSFAVEVLHGVGGEGGAF